MKKFFSVNVNRYVENLDFEVFYPASLFFPKDHSVTFLTVQNIKRSSVFEECNNCLIFWPQNHEVPENIKKMNHAIVLCSDPHLRFCQFFMENGIDNLPVKEKYRLEDGAYIGENAQIGRDVLIQPGAYISGETIIGNNSYIGCGVKIIGKVTIGENVVIRENSVIGADGLTTDRDEDGRPVRMPQFGGVNIENNVTIGAGTVVARGAIDDTVIGSETSIDNCVFVSHNVQIGKRVFIVGESILFGSAKIGANTLISGNSTIRNGVQVGHDALIGMGSVVTRNIDDGMIVKGNPAKEFLQTGMIRKKG